MKCARFAAMATIAVLFSACSGRSIPDVADPAVAAEAIRTTAPEQPLRVIFSWRALERDARFHGRGAARIEAPYRARLDLFGPTGDGYLSAALVDHELRLPPGSPPVQLPPAAMMWAVLGVVSPPDDAVLRGTREEPGRTELYYELGGGLLRYDLRGGSLAGASWEAGDVSMEVRLSGSAELGLPGSALYRDLARFTELELNLESVDEVEPYPQDVWTPGR